MRAVVVYESMYGNTKWIAESIAEGIRVHLPVEVIEVGSAPAEVAADIGLLVVGGPTHAFGLSRPSTRHDAAQRKGGSVVSDRIGLREWLA
ncbi:MAG TPA: flavodoxin domain-containing protein, partial [Egibacteraceae bacterium]|nr:flavodoxin domain-containing protein [Egibacteraceae bacterium]